MAFGITESGVVYANLGLKGLGLSATNYSAAVTSATGTGVRVYANAAVSATQTALSESDFATAILTNLGVTAATVGQAAYAALQPAVAGYLNSVGKANYGVVAVQLATILSGLTADGTYGAAAKQLNNAAASAYAYGTTAANTTDKVINVATEAAPVTNFALTAATAGEILVGTSGNDIFAGTKDSIDAGDKILDSSTTDSDVANLSFNAATPALTLQNIENVNITVSSVSAVTAADATNFSGVQNLTVTKTDVVVGGSSIVGDKAVTVTAVDASKVAKVTTGAGTKAVSVTQATKAGATIDATTATGTIAVTGAGTVLADTTATTVTITALGDTTEDAKALTVNAAKASSVTTASGFTGVVTVNAAAATAVTVNGASGGATINAAKAGATGITVAGIDDSGATITTGSYTKAAAGVISVDGSVGTTDVATISAAGYISLATAATAQVENLNLSGNGAAVTYTLTGTPTKTTLTGTQDVTLVGASSQFTTNTLVDSTTAGTTTVSLTTVATGDLSKIAADKIQIAAAAGAAATLTVATGASVEIAKDQAQNLTLTGKTASATINVSTGDDTAASGATIDIALGGNLVFGSTKTANLDASIGKLTVAGNTDLGATTATLNVTGSKDVNLGTATQGKAIAAGSFAGALTVTSTGVNTITTGAGADAVTVNNNANVFTVNEGDGNNTLTITAAAATSSFSTGAGDDTITINSANSIVVVAGAGNDTVTIGTGIDSDAIIVGGDGTDTLSFAAGAAKDLSDNTNFNFSGFEKVTLDGFQYDVKASVFAGDNAFALTGASAATSVLHVVGTDATTAYTIDASKVTFASTQNATLKLEGNALADTITGSGKADTIVATAGADVVDGGAGTDTYVATGLYNVKEVSTATNASNGVVINLGTTAVTNTTVLSTTGSFTADSTTSVAAGTTAYLYGSAHSTNSAVSQTLSNIENVIGTAGNDYIVAGSAGSKITGAGGADYIKLGTGADTVVIAAGTDSGTITGTYAGATTATNDTIAGSFDVIYGFTTGVDKLDLTAVNTHTGTTDEAAGPLAANKYQLVRGDWNNATHTFVVNTTTGADEIVIYDVAAGADHALVLVGVAANQLVVGDLV